MFRQARTQRAVHAQQRCEDGQAEARLACRARLHVLLHMADAHSRWRARGVAYCRTAILLRQHEALRTRNRQYTRSPDTCEEDGFFLGAIRGEWQPQHTWHPLGTDRLRNEHDHALGQGLPNGE
jgi:hypothetical protein